MFGRGSKYVALTKLPGDMLAASIAMNFDLGNEGRRAAVLSVESMTQPTTLDVPLLSRMCGYGGLLSEAELSTNMGFETLFVGVPRGVRDFAEVYFGSVDQSAWRLVAKIGIRSGNHGYLDCCPVGQGAAAVVYESVNAEGEGSIKSFEIDSDTLRTWHRRPR